MDPLPPPVGQAPLPPAPEVPGDIEHNKDMAALSYAWVLSVIIFFARRDSPFVRFHAKQGMVLFLLSILVWPIPFIGRLLELIVVAYCVFGFLAAAEGKWKQLPLIAPLSHGDWKNVRAQWRGIVSAIVRLWHKLRPVAKPSTEGAQSAPPPVPPTPPAV